jgi:hypothetical protein
MVSLAVQMSSSREMSDCDISGLIEASVCHLYLTSLGNSEQIRTIKFSIVEVYSLEAFIMVRVYWHTVDLESMVDLFLTSLFGGEFN